MPECRFCTDSVDNIARIIKEKHWYKSSADNIKQDSHFTIMPYKKSVPELIVTFMDRECHMYFQISYCPICGRKLITDKAEEKEREYNESGLSDEFGRMVKLENDK